MSAAHLNISERGLRPHAELYAGKPHGQRLRYMAGCRCFQCRRANSQYEADRKIARAAGDWNGIVPAVAARNHLRKLSRLGVGRRAVQAATDIGDTILQEIKTGRRLHIRARTARKILAVTAAAISDRALVPAGPLWTAIDALVALGYPKRFLAHQLGYAAAIQFNRVTVTAKNEQRVLKLHARLITRQALDTLRSERARIKHQPARIVHILEDE